MASGGAMLVMEGHSDGSAGPLSYLIVIWWDKAAQRYGFFTCFKDAESGCQVRGTAGTAHWEGDKPPASGTTLLGLRPSLASFLDYLSDCSCDIAG
jgi:hypothetical protein